MKELRTINHVQPRELILKKSEVARYLKYGNKVIDSNVDKLIDEAMELVYDVAKPKSVFVKTTVDCSVSGFVLLDSLKFESANLYDFMNPYKTGYIFAATIGIELDREIEKYSKYFPSKATVCHAAGAAYVESFCDYVCETLAEKKGAIKRFSPGYGDLSLEYQKPILDYLDANKKVGIVLNESLIMAPSKSVTAIMGV